MTHVNQKTKKIKTITKKEFGLAADSVKHFVPQDDTFFKTGTFIGRHVFGYNVAKAKIIHLLRVMLGDSMQFSDIWDILSWLTLDEHVGEYCKKRLEHNKNGEKRTLNRNIKRRIAYGLINIIDEWIDEEYDNTFNDFEQWHDILFDNIKLVEKYYTPDQSIASTTNSKLYDNNTNNDNKSNSKSRSSNCYSNSNNHKNNYKCTNDSGKLIFGSIPPMKRSGNGFGCDPKNDCLNLWVCKPETKSRLLNL